MINPFTSKLYVNTWLKHFKDVESVKTFKAIKDVSFFKSKFLPLYTNVGKNLTKGVNYNIDYESIDYKGKTFLIYDVPEYFKQKEFKDSANSLKLKKVFQYKGFALDYNDFSTPEDYINSRISSKNRRGYRSRLKRLEQCFDIRYEFLFDEVKKAYFDTLFEKFHALLSKRFAGKQVNYHHLEPKKWGFYKEVVFEMLKKKQASLFTIYNGETPIGMTLNFHSEDIAFVAITVFDPDYFKFNVGKASIVKLLEWSYEQNIKIMDFSKGEFDFKYEWCNLVYDFDYHILYDSKSLLSNIIANSIASFFKLKLYLREKSVNTLYRKVLHNIKGGKKNNINSNYNVSFIENLDVSSLNLININEADYSRLKAFVYSFLFANPQNLDTLEIYKSPEKDDYYIKGDKKIQLINFTA